MHWQDDGIVIAARHLGEGGLVVSLLTRDHGRHPGLVRGGAARRNRATFEPGTLVAATWRGRLAEQLGTLSAEPLHGYAAAALSSPTGLAGLAAACAVAETALPERQPHPGAFDALHGLLGALGRPDWPGLYVKWELLLLAELGFGLDLSACAATGESDSLAFVSPKTGRAVSAAAGAPYRGVLLPLPGFVLDEGGAPAGAAVMDGLRLSGFFLERHVYHPAGRGLPPARTRLVDRLGQDATIAAERSRKG